METTLFLAQVIGIVALAKAVALFVKRDELKSLVNDLLGSRALLFVLSALELIGGLAIILNHNIWEGGVAIAITIIGWMMVLEGLAFYILPSKSVAPLVRSLNNKSLYKIGSIVALVVGIWFVHFGFFA